MTFEEYLADKKIDSDKFKLAEGELWNSLKEIFELMSPKSFTSQKLFLINPIRRKYLLAITKENTEDAPKKIAKPVIKPAVKKKPMMGRPKLK